MQRVYKTKEQCSGCKSCQLVCPVNAIEMKTDEEGFDYPVIDQVKCIDCGLCVKVCPYHNMDQRPEEMPQPLAYAAKNSDEEVRMKSTSGGAFTAITNQFLSEFSDGVIYGAAFSDDFTVGHIRGDHIEQRDQMRGSKYVKSDLNKSYTDVEEDLNTGKHVIFSGTGCEISGLFHYLESKKVSRDHLLLIDIVCHGTPSPMVWKDYLTWIQEKEPLKAYTFRNKEKAWRGFQLKADYESGRVERNSPKLLSYTYLYGGGLTMRPCCYTCPYATSKRYGDITIGDFWGIEKTMGEMDDKKGVSVLLVSTKKGQEFLERVQKDMTLKQCHLEDALQYNLVQATRKPELRDKFFELYNQEGYIEMAKQYGAYSFLGQLRKFAGKMMRKLK